MVVTNTALSSILSSVVTDLSSDFTHIAIGDDNTAPTVSDTALGNETDIEALFSTIETTTFNISGEIFLDSTENNGSTIAECGVFNAASGGTMLTRNLTNTIAKTSSIEIFLQVIINFEVVNV